MSLESNLLNDAVRADRSTSLTGRVATALDSFFKVSARGSTLSKEIRGGFIAWMTMSYILVVNPAILCQSGTSSNPMNTEAVMAASAFSAAVGSLVLGMTSDAPLALMPGMGLNAYFTFGICKAFGVTWQQGLSCSFMSGLVLFVLAVIGVCNRLVSLILGDHLKKAITVAIGLFQALIGFQKMGLIVSSPETLVTLGDLSLTNQHLYLALAGLCLISVMLVSGKIPGALLIGIWLMAGASWVMGLQEPPQGFVSLPKLDTFGVVDFSLWDPQNDKLLCMIGCSAVLLFVALFDLAGVQYGLMGIAGLLQDGGVPKSRSIFASAGLSTMVGACMGTSPVIIANECSAGIAEGARTGLMGVVVAALFLLAAFIGPLMSAVPPVSTSVPLILIGVFMVSPCADIAWDNLRVGIPSFLTVTLVPLTYSIHTGIIAGILMDGFLAIFDMCSPKEVSLKSESSICPPSPHTTAIKSPGLRKRATKHLLSNLSNPGEDPDDDELRAALEKYLKFALDVH